MTREELLKLLASLKRYGDPDNVDIATIYYNATLRDIIEVVEKAWRVAL